MELLAYIYMTLAQKPDLQKGSKSKNLEKQESQEIFQYVAVGL
ncbi:hypothetical protein [Floridanema aerugineum]|jgi:hypothetical protein|uniref:Uncharacterized protein n=1 Tax=Floridaenema aerugineum BLCC-F46 TaxID=3153654 RepID=A0ABV4X7S9_9CYAN